MLSSFQEDLAVKSVESITKSMIASGGFGMDSYPVTLALSSRSRRVSKALESTVEMVPCWMFLRWLPQMLAAISDPLQRQTVGLPLKTIASTFPQAIFYVNNSCIAISISICTDNATDFVL